MPYDDKKYVVWCGEVDEVCDSWGQAPRLSLKGQV